MLYDLVSLGEPLLRLAPPGQVQLRCMSSLDAHLAGAQMNVAADLACLGLRTALLTQLPDTPLGLWARDACRAVGLDTTYIHMTAEGRMGVVYCEFSAAPRAPVSVFDRADSAASCIGPDTFAWPEILAQTRYAYTDGIFPGISASCAEASLVYLQTARQLGVTTSFDTNYRTHLWEPQVAYQTWSKLLGLVDVLVTNRTVATEVFGYQGTDEELMRRFAETFGCRIVNLTQRTMDGLGRGAWQSQALSGGVVYISQRVDFEIVDRYGTGDAWCAGLLSALLAGQDLAYALDFAGSLCALAHTTEGDVAHFTCDEVTAVMRGEVDLRPKR
jgi:2-dehydro-3-deoxygluconokinase